MELARWIQLTLAGWALGIPLIILLSQILEALGLHTSQFCVGAGMGLGVGLLQHRALRAHLPSPRAWIAATALGLGLPFLVNDAARALGHPLPFSLYIAVATGGLVAGFCQAQVLRTNLPNAALWTLANVCGWSAAAGAVAVADAARRLGLPRGFTGALLYLAIIATGGIALAILTGLALRYRVLADRR